AGAAARQNRRQYANRARTEFAATRSIFHKMGAPPDTSWPAAASIAFLSMTRSITEVISAGIAALVPMQAADGSFPLFTVHEAGTLSRDREADIRRLPAAVGEAAARCAGADPSRRWRARERALDLCRA